MQPLIKASLATILALSALLSALWCAPVCGDERKYPSPSAETWGELVERGDEIARDQKPPRLAEALYRQALEAAHRDEAGSSAESLVLDRLGQALAAQGEERAAEVTFLQSLRLRLGLAGDEESTAETLDHLASLYYQMGHPDEGLAVHEQALRFRRQVFGRESVQAARSMILVASAYEIRGEHPAAEALFRQAVGILRHKAQTDEDRERLSQALISLGELLKRTGRKEEGDELIREGLDIAEPE